METRRDLDTIVKVEKASGVSKGVVERMTKAEANTGVDHLAGIAAAFGVNVWDLLRAPEQAAESSPQPPSLVQALKVVAEAARQQPLDVRANAAEILALVVKQPEKNAPDMIPIIVKHLSGGELSSDSRRAA
jgi:transcriptional regulator with XRE-family HTH domain